MCNYMYIYIDMYICIYVYIYIHTYIYIQVPEFLKESSRTHTMLLLWADRGSSKGPLQPSDCSTLRYGSFSKCRVDLL